MTDTAAATPTASSSEVCEEVVVEELEFEPHGLQVAGHGGALADRAKELFLKRLQAGGRGAAEAAFYDKVGADSRYAKLRAFVPSSRGVVAVGDETYLALEDVAKGLAHPAVLDLKVGFVTGAGAKHAAKDARTTSAEIGFRVSGFQAGDDALGREEARALEARHVPGCLLRFAAAAGKAPGPLLAMWRAQLRGLRDAVAVLDFVRFVGSSVLLVYDGEARNAGSARLRLVDFGNAHEVEPGAEDVVRFGDGLAALAVALEEASAAARSAAQPGTTARPPAARPPLAAVAYVVHLARRTEREANVDETRRNLAADGVDTVVPGAVDGADERAGLPAPYSGWERAEARGLWPPTWGRPLTRGELACAASHHACWAAFAGRKDADVCVVLEDDALVAPGTWARLREELAALPPAARGWDLLYLGRGALQPDGERVSDRLVRPGFSYGAYAYALSRKGAGKLLAGGLLDACLPVDEYLPALYTRHPRDDVADLLSNAPRLDALAWCDAAAPDRGAAAELVSHPDTRDVGSDTLPLAQALALLAGLDRGEKPVDVDVQRSDLEALSLHPMGERLQLQLYRGAPRELRTFHGPDGRVYRRAPGCPPTPLFDAADVPHEVEDVAEAAARRRGAPATPSRATEARSALERMLLDSPALRGLELVVLEGEAPRRPPAGTRYAVLQLEPLAPGAALDAAHPAFAGEAVLALLGGAAVVLDASPARAAALRKAGVPAEHLPLPLLLAAPRPLPNPPRGQGVLLVAPASERGAELARLLTLEGIEDPVRVETAYGAAAATCSTAVVVHASPGAANDALALAALLGRGVVVVAEVGSCASTDAALARAGVALAPYGLLARAGASLVRDAAELERRRALTRNALDVASAARAEALAGIRPVV